MSDSRIDPAADAEPAPAETPSATITDLKAHGAEDVLVTEIERLVE